MINPMRNKIKTIVIAGLMLIAIPGCEKTEEETPTDIRYDYVGTWISTEPAAKGVDATYTVGITVDGMNSSQVILSNYMNLGTNVKAEAIVTETTITIPLQTIGSWSVSGTGSLVADGEIRWSRCTANQINTTAVYRRQ